MFYFPPNGLDLRSTIFVYSGACKAKSLQGMRISLIQTTWRIKTTLSCNTRTVVVEVKYFSTQNDVIHTENCNLELPLDCSTTQMERNICRMCGIEESSRRRGFADLHRLRLPRTSEEVSQLHQSQHSGLATISRLQNEIKHGVALNPLR